MFSMPLQKIHPSTWVLLAPIGVLAFGALSLVALLLIARLCLAIVLHTQVEDRKVKEEIWQELQIKVARD